MAKHNKTMTATATSRRISTASLGCATLSILIGLCGYTLQQDIQKRDVWNTEVQAACQSIEYSSMEQFVQETGLQPYDRRVGWIVADPWVCIATQQWHRWSDTTGATGTDSNFIITMGMFLMGVKTMLQLPIMAITMMELGRSRRGIQQYPTLLCLLYFLFGTSLTFPLLWIPSYLLLSGRNHNPTTNNSSLIAAIAPRQSALACLLALLPAVLFLANTVFLTPGTPIWRASVGLLGGSSPILAILPVLAYWILFPRPLLVPPDCREAVQSAKASATAHSLLGLVTLVGWVVLGTATLYHNNNNRNDSGATNDALWQEIVKDPSLQSLLVEIITVYASCMILIAHQSPLSALEGIIITPFCGPAAAITMELATLEVEQFTVPKTTFHRSRHNKNDKMMIMTKKHR